MDSKSIIRISLFPALLIAWGCYIFYFFDPFFARTVDPEYPYLINGLNIAQARFNFIGHFDHPGTPFQVFNAIVIRLTHLFTGSGNIAEDVFKRPEHYLKAISASLFVIQAALIGLVGFFSLKRKIPFGHTVILQASFLLSSELIWLFVRATPDRFFMIVGLIFTLVYLAHGHENRHPAKFAFWSGVTMALGFATKFNFLPALLLPLLFIQTNKNRAIYSVTGILSFFVFILPIINRFKEFRKFISGIISHDGLYGGGSSNVLNIQKMLDSLAEIIKLNPGLVILVLVLIVLLVVAMFKKFRPQRKYAFFFAGYLLILIVQVVMVSKHFKNYYMAPSFVFFGFMLFTVAAFLSEILNSQKKAILLSSILPMLLVVFSFTKASSDYQIIVNRISQEKEIRDFTVQNISRNDFWFVQPTWEGAPFQENALVYGISYCGHREEYLPQLVAASPNIVTYEYNNEQVKLWRCATISLDSVVSTGRNIHLYSTPGRNADQLLQLVVNAAARNSYQLQTDTVYANTESKSYIIRTKATNTKSNWKPGNSFAQDRESRINAFIEAIKNSPEWLEAVKEKAKKKNIPLDSMILLDAIHMVNVGK